MGHLTTTHGRPGKITSKDFNVSAIQKSKHLSPESGFLISLMLLPSPQGVSAECGLPLALLVFYTQPRQVSAALLTQFFTWEFHIILKGPALPQIVTLSSLMRVRE